ncbi:MAG TPA: 50S ribosomal protein L6 [Nitrospirae bacterium]|nr:50S ribosomal protein L6 [Nitrospirota bacterium]
MSRIGRKPIELPKGVEVNLSEDTIRVKGPRGELQWQWPSGMTVTVEEGRIVVKRPNDTKKNKALHGLTRSIIANMVKGVSEGFKKELHLVGIGYRVDLKGQSLMFSLGYSHPVEFPLPEGITAEIDHKARPLKLTLQGIDKQLLGQVAANIRSLRPPDAYKGKGIRYADERLKLKPGKTAK